MVNMNLGLRLYKYTANISPPDVHFITVGSKTGTTAPVSPAPDKVATRLVAYTEAGRWSELGQPMARPNWPNWPNSMVFLVERGLTCTIFYPYLSEEIWGMRDLRDHRWSSYLWGPPSQEAMEISRQGVAIQNNGARWASFAALEFSIWGQWLCERWLLRADRSSDLCWTWGHFQHQKSDQSTLRESNMAMENIPNVF